MCLMFYKRMTHHLGDMQRWEFIKEGKKTRKHAFDKESDQEKKEENTLSTKKAMKKKR